MPSDANQVAAVSNTVWIVTRRMLASNEPAIHSASSTATSEMTATRKRIAGVRFELERTANVGNFLIRLVTNETIAGATAPIRASVSVIRKMILLQVPISSREPESCGEVSEPSYKGVLGRQ